MVCYGVLLNEALIHITQIKTRLELELIISRDFYINANLLHLLKALL